MGRIDPLPREALPQYEELWDTTDEFMGVLPNSLLTMAKKPELFERFMEWSFVVLRPDEVDAGLKQLVAMLASTAQGCRYCQAHTANHAKTLEVDDAKIAAAYEFDTSPLFTDAERAALRVAWHGGMNPNQVSDEDFAALRKHFSEEQCIEIVAVIAFFGHMNRWNDTMATTLEAAPRAYAEQHLADNGGWEIGRHHEGPEVLA
jgi:uncharacterized peroxidase-related enzyme